MKHCELFDTAAYQAGLIEAGVEPLIAKAHCDALMAALMQVQASWRSPMGEASQPEPKAAINNAEQKRLKERIWILLWLVQTALISAILGGMMR